MGLFYRSLKSRLIYFTNVGLSPMFSTQATRERIVPRNNYCPNVRNCMGIWPMPKIADLEKVQVIIM